MALYLEMKTIYKRGVHKEAKLVYLLELESSLFQLEILMKHRKSNFSVVKKMVLL